MSNSLHTGGIVLHVYNSHPFIGLFEIPYVIQSRRLRAVFHTSQLTGIVASKWPLLAFFYGHCMLPPTLIDMVRKRKLQFMSLLLKSSNEVIKYVSLVLCMSVKSSFSGQSGV